MAAPRIIPLDLVGSSKFERYSRISSEDTFNLYESGGALVNQAGYQAVLQLKTESVGRATYYSPKLGQIICVVGVSVYVVNPNLSRILVGAVDNLVGPCSIAENNNDEIAICDGINIFVLNYENDTFTKATIDFNAGYVSFHDGYFLASVTDTNRWRLSSINDGLDWPLTPNTDGVMQSSADTCQAVVRFQNSLYVFGTNITEVWRDAGNPVFPYSRDNNLLIEYGCLNTETIAQGFGLMCWLGFNNVSGPSIMVSNGGAPERISTDGITYLLDTLKAPQDSFATIREEDGHILYAISFFTDNLSFLYDFTTQAFFSTTDHNLNYLPIRSVVRFRNTHWFLSKNNGMLYELSTTIPYMSDMVDGPQFIVPRVRITKPYRQPNGQPFAINELTITLDQGTDNQNGYVFNGQTNEQIRGTVQLSFSKDGGHTYSDPVDHQLNEVGNRESRVQFHRLGWANDICFQVRYNSSSRCAIIGGTITIED